MSLKFTWIVSKKMKGNAINMEKEINAKKYRRLKNKDFFTKGVVTETDMYLLCNFSYQPLLIFNIICVHRVIMKGIRYC